MNEKSTIPTGFDQQLAKALRPGAAPEDLRLSLLRAAQSRRPRRTWHALGIAATLMFLLGSGAWGWMAHWNSHEGERFTQAVLQNYMEVQNMDFTMDASDQDSVEQCMDRCKRWSTKAVGFAAHLPKGLANQPLKGGRACIMASCRAACFYLKDGRAVYVFDRTLRGLDANSIKRPLIVASGLRGTAWNEDGRGYILVEPPSFPRI
jgi:hypothetical protein